MNKYLDIIVTQNAWKKIFEISKKNNINNFLLSANSGGCNGFNYDFKTIDLNKYKDIINNNKFKTTIIKKENKNILIDPKSEYLLCGTKIDYIFENYSKGLFENKFVFIPNKSFATSCGCGTSFSIK
tara:strand:- start:194 stop:574 length:381 start_codon:yes stop_codon:yes gene_type:complete